MPSRVIVGLQWGDEGKGKISAYLSRGAELVVRFNGGANAGHTVTYRGETLKFHMVPAGVVSARSAAIGPAVYLDLDVLIEELSLVSRIKGDASIYISPRAQVVAPIHRDMDAWMESQRGRGLLGTTRRGIGPAAMDKYARLGLRISDILEDDDLEKRIELMAGMKPFLGSIQASKLAEHLREKAGRIASHVVDIGEKVEDTLRSGGYVVFEGAQGTMLDIDHGTYPYVTSSNTVAGAASAGCGIGPKRIDEVLGVMKSYTTRVGAGPFPTEVEEDTAGLIREKGGEYGATTGRPRRIGWLDLPLLRYAVRLNGADGLIVTKLDTLSGLAKLKVCVAYELEGRRVQSFPETAEKLARVKPIYREFEGWRLREDERRSLPEEGYGALPREAMRYIDFIEEELGVPVRLISVGPSTEEVVER